MPNANFITQFEYKLNNLTGTETQAELLALRSTSDKYPELNVSAVALLDAAIASEADALTNSSTIKELSIVGQASATASKDVALNIGDYTQSSRTLLPDGRALIPADGRLISGGTYPLLEAALETRDKLDDVKTTGTETGHRSFCAQADGSKGWFGTATGAEIREVDFTTGQTTLVYTYPGVGGYSSITCSDDGQNIYASFIRTTSDAAIIVYSNDGGSSWSNKTVLSVTAASSLSTTSDEALGVVECDGAGTNVKYAFTGSSSETTTRVFESNDSGANWSEILTPAVALTAPQTVNEVFISRDLSTVGVLNLGSVANQRWLSVDGAAFVDTYDTLPARNQAIESNATRRTVVSADGSNFFMYFTLSNQSSYVRAHASTDNMATWSPLVFSTYGRNGVTYASILSAQFHPANNERVFVTLSSGTQAADTPAEIIVVEVDIVSGSTKPVGTVQVSTNGSWSTIHTQIQSSIRINNGNILLCNSDAQTLDQAFVIQLKNGKYLADASAEPLPYKVVADAL